MEDIKVIVLKSKYTKALIGFSSNPKIFIDTWISIRPQYSELSKITDTHYSIRLDDNSELHHFYITSIRDNETCFVSLNDNCMEFNDNH